MSLAKPSLRTDVRLAPYTTFGIGGPADLLTVPKSASELAAAVRWARAEDLPWFVLGCGANILVGDKGVRGLVIKNEADKVSIDGSKLTAESGITIAKLIDLTIPKGLSGFEHYVEIPSTLGGALWQNLHFLSYPHKRTHFIEEIVESATVLVSDQEQTVDREYFKFGYDTSVLHHNDDVVLDVTVKLKPADPEQLKLVAEKNAEWRHAKHPPNAVRMSAGSIFRKIEGVGAGRLVDQAGLKGHRIGGAEVSPKHANYMLNVGKATAADVRALIAHVQQIVKQETGHWLEPEISFVGEF
jgi:UDP-N-acetylmuramate dehydrogenase